MSSSKLWRMLWSNLQIWWTCHQHITHMTIAGKHQRWKTRLSMPAALQQKHWEEIKQRILKDYKWEYHLANNQWGSSLFKSQSWTQKILWNKVRMPQQMHITVNNKSFSISPAWSRWEERPSLAERTRKRKHNKIVGVVWLVGRRNLSQLVLTIENNKYQNLRNLLQQGNSLKENKLLLRKMKLQWLIEVWILVTLVKSIQH